MYALLSSSKLIVTGNFICDFERKKYEIVDTCFRTVLCRRSVMKMTCSPARKSENYCKIRRSNGSNLVGRRFALAANWMNRCILIKCMALFGGGFVGFQALVEQLPTVKLHARQMKLCARTWHKQSVHTYTMSVRSLTGPLK